MKYLFAFFLSLLSGAAGVLALVSWLVGVVLAKGFWSTVFAVTLPPYAWYLVVEKCAMALGWV